MSSESRSASISASSPATSSSSSPSGKRTRDPEDEVYLDNLRSQKRYLSEIMACSLNGLTVGDSLPVNMLESPARSESSLLYHRDELPLQYSPMSEDSDETRFCDEQTSIISSSQQPESRPTSPISPYRYQKPLTPTTTTTTTTTTPQPRRSSPDSTEGRFPSSPSDICHSGDLRRTALLRSVQMRTQPCGGYNNGSSSSTSSGASNIVVVDGEERMMMCCNKSMELEEGEEEGICYSSDDHHQVSSKSKSCKVLDMRDYVKGE